MSNAERQRQFRERNPGYYGRLHARQRAAIKTEMAQHLAAVQATAVRREPLMLPAPVETIEIPGMTIMDELAGMKARLVSLQQVAAAPPQAAKSLAA